MSAVRTTLSRFLIEEQRRLAGGNADLAALLNDVQTACKYIASAVARGALRNDAAVATQVNVQGEEQCALDVVANELFIQHCEWGGQLAAMASEEMADILPTGETRRRGRYLLAFDPLDGSSNLDVNVSVGSIFSILEAPAEAPVIDQSAFLQPGVRQVAAGYAIYGPAAMMVLTLGEGTHGFTLDREIGAFLLTHPDLRIPEEARVFAVNASNERFWEPPVKRYVEECLAGRTGPRGADFNMRWIASLVAEVHRILLRGGLFMYPKDSKEPAAAGRLRLLYEANPMAMIVEQAGGAATTGRERLLDLVPQTLHQRVPVILGSRREVERLTRYHDEFDRGVDRPYESPLFNERSMLRAGARL